jgi:chromosome partitioning protein
MADTALMTHTALDHCIAVANTKGGAGKTTIAAALATEYAARGVGVLMVDLDKQANAAIDLGLRDNDDDDGGMSLRNTLISPMVPIRPVSSGRDNLDFVFGGIELRHLLDGYQYLKSQNRHFSALGDALAPIADQYDLIVIDCPPDEMMIGFALGASRHLLVPVNTDEATTDNLPTLTHLLNEVVDLNPKGDILGVVPTTIRHGSAMEGRLAEVRAAVGRFVSVDKITTATIRDAPDTMKPLRKYPMTVVEVVRERPEGLRLYDTHVNLAAEFAALADEVADRLESVCGVQL